MDQQEDMQVFYEIFDASLPRLGPGDDASTRRALSTLLSARPRGGDVASAARLRVLDIGCGTGAPTIQLAKLIDGTILAVDNHQPFLDELQRRWNVSIRMRQISFSVKPLFCPDLAC